MGGKRDVLNRTHEVPKRGSIGIIDASSRAGELFIAGLSSEMTGKRDRRVCP
jgi:hypothetical protein